MIGGAVISVFAFFFGWLTLTREGKPWIRFLKVFACAVVFIGGVFLILRSMRS